MNNELHNSSYLDLPTFQNNEEQRGLLCGNKASVGSSPKLSKETLDALEELGAVIKSIRTRMYNEGYEIVDGVVQKRDLKCI